MRRSASFAGRISTSWREIFRVLSEDLKERLAHQEQLAAAGGPIRSYLWRKCCYFLDAELRVVVTIARDVWVCSA
eukprot:1667662-Rhodomonas_salina.1